MPLTIVTAPSEEPITTAEAKSQARVEVADDDTIIGTMITAARQHAETVTRRAFATQTWDLFLDSFPSERIDIPLPPLQSVTSIKYIDEDGVQQTWDSSKYRVDTDSEPARITPAYDETWPTARNVTGAIEVRFVAGYGAAAAVPEGIKSWLKVRVATMYEHREQFFIGANVGEMPFIDGLLDPYRVRTF